MEQKKNDPTMPQLIDMRCPHCYREWFSVMMKLEETDACPDCGRTVMVDLRKRIWKKRA